MSNWESDAALAGTLYKKSKPYTALLIARCVEPGTGGARLAQNAPVKPSAREFSEMSGIARNTINKYLAAWDVMAERGYVPDRTELEPGEDIDVPDMKVWTECYRIANPPKEKKEPKEVLASEQISIDTPKVVKSVQMVRGINASRIEKEAVRISMERIQEAITKMAMEDNKDRYFVALCSALSDLAAEL